MHYVIRAKFIIVMENSDNESLNHLAKLVAKGHVEAFDEIYEQILARLRRMVNIYEFNHHDREDLEQELWLKAYELCARYDPSLGHYRHYLFRTAKYILKTRRNMKNEYYGNMDYIEEFENFYDYAKCSDSETSPTDAVMYESHIDTLSKSDRFSTLEKRMLLGLRESKDADTLRSELHLNEEGFKNTYYRVRSKVKFLNDATNIDKKQ